MRDAGAAAQLAALYDFFAPLPFWRMGPRPERVPGDALCLAAEGEVYVVYLPHGGKCRLLPDRSVKALRGRWFDPRKGSFAGQGFPVGGDTAAPDASDWVLLADAS